MNKKTFTNTKRKAFSLIELSIVLIIIGLLIAGVTGGASLVKNSELRKITEEARGYQTAVNSFYAKYNALPGDFNTVIGTMIGANAATGVANVPVGNNDGLITFANGADSIVQAACATVNTCGRLEGNMAWQMLKNDNFINESFIPATANTTTATTFTTALTGGTNVPASKSKGGGWIFDNVAVGPTGTTVAQNAVILFGGSTGTIVTAASTAATLANNAGLVGGTSTTSNQSQLLPTEALSIDTKVDDGVANTGKVSSLIQATNNNCNGANAAAYTTANNYKACALVFQVDPNS